MKRTILILWLLLLLTPASAEVFVNRPKPADWEQRNLLKLTCIGTTKNDALLLEAGGKTMLIDGGSGKWWEMVMEAINARGLNSHVDVIYNTHPHDDHTEAVVWMLKHHGLTTDKVISTFPAGYRSEWQTKLMTALDLTGTPYRQLSYGEVMDFGGAQLTFWYNPGGQDPNASSSICRITWGDASVLLTGDITGAASQYFLDHFTSEQLGSDIMKVPHHGLVRMVEDFIDLVSPEFAFVTNREMDTRRIANQLKRHKIKYLYNSTGSIFMETDGKDWYVTMTKGVY